RSTEVSPELANAGHDRETYRRPGAPATSRRKRSEIPRRAGKTLVKSSPDRPRSRQSSRTLDTIERLTAAPALRRLHAENARKSREERERPSSNSLPIDRGLARARERWTR